MTGLAHAILTLSTLLVLADAQINCTGAVPPKSAFPANGTFVHGNYTSLGDLCLPRDDDLQIPSLGCACPVPGWITKAECNMTTEYPELGWYCESFCLCPQRKPRGGQRGNKAASLASFAALPSIGELLEYLGIQMSEVDQAASGRKTGRDRGRSSG